MFWSPILLLVEACRTENYEGNPERMRKIDEIIKKRVNAFADTYKMIWKLEQQALRKGRDFPEVVNSIVVVKIPNPTDISLVWVPF
ncbi:hypothetical protein TNCV_245391 [Trichonephila clavipes]|nr:hypothetical protein TNCV_245391 [Trichonephila clavipes]